MQHTDKNQPPIARRLSSLISASCKYQQHNAHYDQYQNEAWKTDGKEARQYQGKGIILFENDLFLIKVNVTVFTLTSLLAHNYLEASALSGSRF